MIDADLARLRALEREGKTEEYRSGAVALAARHPDDVQARMLAAYASDRWGTEEDAVVHYDAVYRLGVPKDEERGFLVGYGSTLRNVGRLEESITVLRGAIASYPDFAPLHAFLGLALHSAGEHAAATAALIDAVILGGPLDGYDRALRYYRDELRK